MELGPTFFKTTKIEVTPIVKQPGFVKCTFHHAVTASFDVSLGGSYKHVQLCHECYDDLGVF